MSLLLLFDQMVQTKQHTSCVVLMTWEFLPCKLWLKISLVYKYFLALCSEKHKLWVPVIWGFVIWRSEDLRIWGSEDLRICEDQWRSVKTCWSVGLWVCGSVDLWICDLRSEVWQLKSVICDLRSGNPVKHYILLCISFRTQCATGVLYEVTY